MSESERKGPRLPGQDAELRRAWQQVSNEDPPPGLDAAIIEAARRSVLAHDAGVTAVRSGPRTRRRFTKWQPLAAAATVAGLAFVLVQLLPRDRDVPQLIRTEESAPGLATAKRAPEGPAAGNATSAKVTSADATSADATSAGAAAAPGEVAHAPGPVAAREGQRTTMGVPMPGPAVPVTSPPPASAEASDRATAPAAERSRDDAASLSAADWTARIAAQYASGDTAGAADALRAFRAADPDADTYLPESLRDWARTVK
jgi:resuscitation-promoting factor RpfA